MKRNVGPKSEGSKLLILRLPRAEAFGADAVSHNSNGALFTLFCKCHGRYVLLAQPVSSIHCYAHPGSSFLVQSPALQPDIIGMAFNNTY